MADENVLQEHRNELARYDSIGRAIRSCLNIDEVKHVRDKVLAIEIYAAQAKNYELEQGAAKIRLRAEQRVGELTKEMAERGQRQTQKRGGGRPAKNVSDRPIRSEPTPKRPTLADLGISPQQSSDWQKMATIPERVFEAELNKPNPTTASMVRLADELLEQAKREANVAAPKHRRKTSPGPLESSPNATWLWAHIRAFEEKGLLKGTRDPHVLFDAMESGMRKDVKRIVPRLISWLQKLTG